MKDSDCNTLKKANPELASEWHPTKNGKLRPDEVTIGSHKNVWWLGVCGHEWEAVVKDRVRGYGCPICAGKRVVKGVNDLKTVNPELAREWHPTKNGKLRPDEVITGSHRKVWWLGSCGHEWEASIYERAIGRGCPICAGKVVLKGFNDLETKSPFLASEWNISKNGALGPANVAPQSHKTVWWTCSLCGFEWEAPVYSRQAGNGCPKCAKRLQSSFPEQALYYYIGKAFPDTINGYRDIFDNVMELDIYIPSEHVGIEYDGKHWHDSKSRKRELLKYQICKEYGIRLVRVREAGNLLDYEICDDLIITEESLEETIRNVASLLNVTVDVDVSRDRLVIYSRYIEQLRDNSLLSKYPEIAREWHPKKNEGLRPEFFSPRNDAKVWWLCPREHEYQCTIAHKTAGSNCPYCSNRKLLKGYNDFATTNDNPKLLEEWDYEENAKLGISPDSLTKGSKKKVWWKCSKGHRWQTTIAERNRGSGCPVCSGRLVDTGVNDLKTLRPELICEWNTSKNDGLLPSQVSVNSNKKVWWKCSKCGNEWEAIVQVRSRGAGCPECAKKRKITTESFIARMKVVNPSIEIQGDYINTETKIQCRCKKCGMIWTTTPHMLKGGHGCPNWRRHKSM